MYWLKPPLKFWRAPHPVFSTPVGNPVWDFWRNCFLKIFTNESGKIVKGVQPCLVGLLQISDSLVKVMGCLFYQVFWISLLKYFREWDCLLIQKRLVILFQYSLKAVCFILQVWLFYDLINYFYNLSPIFIECCISHVT